MFLFRVVLFFSYIFTVPLFPESKNMIEKVKGKDGAGYTQSTIYGAYSGDGKPPVSEWLGKGSRQPIVE